MNPLATAADTGDLPTAMSLLQIGLSQADKDMALARACCQSHFEIAELLLTNGADPNGQYESEPGRFEYGPIILASCEFLNADGIKWLIEHGADPNGNSADSEHFQCLTPLAMVKETYVDDQKRRQTCVDLLIKSGARIPEP